MVTASPYHPLGGVRNVPGWRLFLSAGLTDETFAAMEDRYRRLGVHRNSHWAFATSVAAMWINWNIWTIVGIAIGSQIPGLEGSGLEFAAIATFIGMVVQKLRTPDSARNASETIAMRSLVERVGNTVSSLR